MVWKNRCTILIGLLLCSCVCVCVCVCVSGHMLDTYKVFSPPYCSSFKFEFALENLLGIPWNVKSTLRSLYHKLTLIQELVINQLPRWDYYLQVKYGHCNTHWFVRQFERFISYTRMVGPNGVPARPWLVLILKKEKKTGLVLILKKTGSCPSGGVRGIHISQPQPVEPPRFESKYLVARIPSLGNSLPVPGP